MCVDLFSLLAVFCVVLLVVLLVWEIALHPRKWHL